MFSELASTRSTCLRRSVGAVIVKDNRIVSTGYNGVPAGLPHCDTLGGCIREKMNIASGERHELSRGLHAEQNAIVSAARFGISLEGAELYCSTRPCVICTKMIIASGIKKVYYYEDYNDELAEEISKMSVVEFLKVAYKPKNFKDQFNY